MPGGCDASLSGDLQEESRNGRSSGWYWRQVSAAIAVGFLRELRIHGSAAGFALLWSVLAPAWLLLTYRLEAHAALMGRLWRMDWPWSNLSVIGLNLASNLIFMGAGAVLYLIPYTGITGSLQLRRLIRSFLWGAQIFVWASACMFMLPLIFPSHAAAALDARTLTNLGQIADCRPWSLATRVPYFLAVLCALWPARARSGNGRGRIAA